MRTCTETADLLKVCRQTFNKMVNNNEVNVIRIRKKRMVSDEELERLGIDNQGVLTAAEAAKELHVCRATIYNMINDNELEVIPFDTIIRIPVREIERIKQRGTV